ncbi:hypothetical protein DITRI_Ditri19aG0064700 [Diplodiscus trichospermus]
MGFNQTLNHFFAFLLILFSFIFFFSSSSRLALGNEILPKINADPSNYQPAAAYRALRVKNATPFLLNKPEFDKKKRKMKMKRRKINKNNFKASSPFSVMLPKGFVPPSGSSPCHNDKPDSSVANVLICGLSGTTTAKAAKP